MRKGIHFYIPFFCIFDYQANNYYYFTKNQTKTMRKLTTQIGVNILGFPIYYESIISQESNKYTGKTKLNFRNQIITQR